MHAFLNGVHCMNVCVCVRFCCSYCGTSEVWLLWRRENHAQWNFQPNSKLIYKYFLLLHVFFIYNFKSVNSPHFRIILKKKVADKHTSEKKICMRNLKKKTKAKRTIYTLENFVDFVLRNRIRTRTKLSNFSFRCFFFLTLVSFEPITMLALSLLKIRTNQHMMWIFEYENHIRIIGL